METATKLIQLEQVASFLSARSVVLLLLAQPAACLCNPTPHPQPSNSSILDSCFAKLHVDMSHLAADSSAFKMLEMWVDPLVFFLNRISVLHMTSSSVPPVLLFFFPRLKRSGATGIYNARTRQPTSTTPCLSSTRFPFPATPRTRGLRLGWMTCDRTRDMWSGLNPGWTCTIIRCVSRAAVVTRR